MSERRREFADRIAFEQALTALSAKDEEIARMRAQAKELILEIGVRDGMINDLQARMAKLEEALAPFAEESLWAGPQHEFVTVKLSDCDSARTAKDEIAALKMSVVAFLAPYAVEYADAHGLPGLHPKHYDLLKECGARMDDFNKADR